MQQIFNTLIIALALALTLALVSTLALVLTLAAFFPIDVVAIEIVLSILIAIVLARL